MRMNRFYRFLIRCFVYLCLVFYCIAVFTLNCEDVFTKETERILEWSCVVPIIGILFGITDILSYRQRDRQRVLHSGKATVGRIVRISYPFASSRTRPESSSILMVSTPLGGKEPLICHTLYVSYAYKGKKYIQESRLRSGICRLEKGALIDIWVDCENPKRFYLHD